MSLMASQYTEVAGKYRPPPSSSGCGLIFLGSACNTFVTDRWFNNATDTSFYWLDNTRTYRKMYDSSVHNFTNYSQYCEHTGYYVSPDGRAFRDTSHPGKNYGLAAPFAYTCIPDDFAPDLVASVKEVVQRFREPGFACKAVTVAIIDPNMRLSQRDWENVRIVHNLRQLEALGTLLACLPALKGIYSTRGSVCARSGHHTIGIISVGDKAASLARLFARTHDYALMSLPEQKSPVFYVIDKGDNETNIVWASCGSDEAANKAIIAMRGRGDPPLACFRHIVLGSIAVAATDCVTVTSLEDFCLYAEFMSTEMDLDLKRGFVDFFSETKKRTAKVMVFDGKGSREYDSSACSFVAVAPSGEQLTASWPVHAMLERERYSHDLLDIATPSAGPRDLSVPVQLTVPRQEPEPPSDKATIQETEPGTRTRTLEPELLSDKATPQGTEPEPGPRTSAPNQKIPYLELADVDQPTTFRAQLAAQRAQLATPRAQVAAMDSQLASREPEPELAALAAPATMPNKDMPYLDLAPVDQKLTFGAQSPEPEPARAQSQSPPEPTNMAIAINPNMEYPYLERTQVGQTLAFRAQSPEPEPTNVATTISPNMEAPELQTEVASLSVMPCDIDLPRSAPAKRKKRKIYPTTEGCAEKRDRANATSYNLRSKKRVDYSCVCK